MKILYNTQGTCSSHVELQVEDNTIRYVRFYGGCNGNLQGICKLVTGRNVDEVIEQLEGIQCNHRPTSCPDQLSKALKHIKQKMAANDMAD